MQFFWYYSTVVKMKEVSALQLDVQEKLSGRVIVNQR